MKNFFKSLYRQWMKFSHLLGLVVTGFWLSVFYYVVLTPIGVTWRILGKNPLRLGWETKVNTYRESSDVLDPRHMEHPY